MKTPTSLATGIGYVTPLGNGPAHAEDLECGSALEQLSAYWRDRGVPLDWVVLACWATLLYRQSGEASLSIAVHAPQAIDDASHGWHSLEVDLTGDPSFFEAVNRLRASRTMPAGGEELPKHGFSGALLSDAASLSCTVDPAPGSELTLGLEMQEEGARLVLQYDARRFDPDTIQRILARLNTVLACVASDPELSVERISILPEEERCELLFDWNATARGFPQPLVHELFEAQVAQTPEAVAVTAAGESLTYAELDARASHLARSLRALGAAPDVPIAVSLPRSPPLVTALLAVLKAGAAYVPLDRHSPTERLQSILNDSGAAIVLGDAEFPPVLLKGRVFLNAERDWAAAGSERPGANGPGATTPDQLAYVLYTSGSSGQPKGVMVSHRNVSNYLLWAKDAYGVDKGNGAPVHTPISFDLTVTSLWVPLISGSGVHLVAEGMGTEQLAAALRSGPDFELVKLTPSHLRMLDRQLAPDEFATATRLLVVGGEALNEKDLRAWKEHAPHCRIVNEYGPTEATVGCIVFESEVGQLEPGPVPIGWPIANVQSYVLDQQLQPVPRGTVGELFLSGAGIARGYLGRADLTEARFLPHPFNETPGARLYRTGDLVRQRPDGALVYVGREDQQIKIQGHRIEPGEIEGALAKHILVRDVAVFSRTRKAPKTVRDSRNCTRCFVSSLMPEVTLDAQGVCAQCRDFETYKGQIEKYFGSEDDLERILMAASDRATGEYDCLLLYSGGKDSTYALYRIVSMGLRVLTFTFDNGFISPMAFVNINKTCAELGVRNIVTRPAGMSEVFAESLERDSAVCSGCFRGINAFATKLALRYGIPICVNGLSQGQIYEMKLAPYIRQRRFNIKDIEADLLVRRKMYHSQADRIGEIFKEGDLHENGAFDQVDHLDYFRYCDATKSEIFRFLQEHVAVWKNPEDTGFCSSNCQINNLGISVHLQQRGYHYYTDSLSWELRLGHIDREEGLQELREEIDEAYVNVMLERVGYRPRRSDGDEEQLLCACVVAREALSVAELRGHLSRFLPEWMIPSHFVFSDSLPVDSRGKLRLDGLPELEEHRPPLRTERVAPQSPLQERLVAMWEDVLELKGIGIRDDFFDLGGTSVRAVELVVRIEEVTGHPFGTAALLQAPTIEKLAARLEDQSIESHPTVVPVQANGTRTPFFCVSALGVLMFERLSRLLGADQPFYGCQAPGYDSDSVHSMGVGEIARLHVEGLRAIQPRGPYLLGGQCFGGSVAWEMARQLVAAGEEVPLVVLFDSRRPLRYGRLTRWILRKPTGRRIRLHLEALSHRDLGAKLRYVVERAKTLGLRTIGREAADSDADEYPVESSSDIEFVRANERGEADYFAQRAPSQIVHFVSAARPILSRRDRRVRWSEVAEHGMELHEVAGEHLDMFKEPHCRKLAQRLLSSLEEAVGGRARDPELAAAQEPVGRVDGTRRRPW